MTKLVVFVCGALVVGACVGQADDSAAVGEDLAVIEPDAGGAADDTPIDPIDPIDPTIDPAFKLIEQLNVVRAGTGAGVVTSSPAGITCGVTCTANYRYGTAVTLIATPQPGSVFVGWTGACVGVGACTVTMTSSVSVAATFVQQQYPIQISLTGNGAGTVVSSPGGINCAPTCVATYPYGTFVTLTAIPAPGSTFAGWSGACTGAATCTVQTTQARSVAATFTQVPVAITINATGDATGTILASNGQACAAPGTCTIVVPYGTQLVLTPQPATGAMFAGWSGACAGTAACAIIATAPITVGAEFDRATYTLTVQPSSLGRVTGAGISCGYGGSICSVQVPRGTYVQLAFTGRATSRYCISEDVDATGCDYVGGGCTLTADHDATVAVTWLVDCWYY